MFVNTETSIVQTQNCFQKNQDGGMIASEQTLYQRPNDIESYQL